MAALDGSFMMLVDRSQETLETFATELTQSGAQVHAISIDLTNPNAGDIIENSLSERGLYCDVLVNNAGVGLFGAATEIDRAAQMRLLDLNIRALTELTLRFLPGMVARDRGGVLNLGSIAGYTPGPNMAIYHASKAYVRSFSAAIAAEVAGTGVTVTCLIPGVVRTAFYRGMPVKQMLLFKAIPRSDALDTAKAGWRGFRAGKRLVIPRLVDRILAIFLIVLPDRAIPRLTAKVKLPL